MKTDIAVVLDRSGSMQSIKDATLDGFNKFLEEQKAAPGECSLTLVQFDDHYEVVHKAIDIKDVPHLTASTFVPRGTTALLDAMGKLINDTGARLQSIPEDQRPDKVIFVVITDGAENASREFKREQIFEMVSHQRDKYSWEFVFLGANIDSIATATSLGFQGSNAMNYVASDKGTRSAWVSLSNSMTSYRGSGPKLSNDFFGDKQEDDSKDKQDSPN